MKPRPAAQGQEKRALLSGNAYARSRAVPGLGQQVLRTDVAGMPL
jgi:hypothetical protein